MNRGRYSSWQYLQVILGGESFIAQCQGLQNAIDKNELAKNGYYCHKAWRAETFRVFVSS